jgi:hypothetical protein
VKKRTLKQKKTQNISSHASIVTQETKQQKNYGIKFGTTLQNINKMTIQTKRKQRTRRNPPIPP